MCNVQWDFSSLTRQKNFPNWGTSFSWLNKIRQPFMVLFVLSRIFSRLFLVSNPDGSRGREEVYVWYKMRYILVSSTKKR